MSFQVPDASSEPPESARSGTRASFREVASDALRYWEPRRVVYNLALGAIVMGHVYGSWPRSQAFLTRDGILGAFLLAVLANVDYCAAYAVDLFVQFSGLRETWGRWRWVVLITGTAFAGVITHFVAMGTLNAGGAG